MRRHRFGFQTASALVVAAMALAAQPSQAEDFERHREFSEGPISVTVDVSGKEEDGLTADVKVSENGTQVLHQTYTDLFSPIALPEISFQEMDKGNDTKELFVSVWTGGAHCCTAISVYTKTSAGWVALDAGAYDGDPLEPVDADGDGQAEISTFDNAFLYQFSSYAGSFAPPKIIGVRNGAIADISAEPGFKPLFEAYLKDMGEIPAEGSDRNSWLAAQAATRLRLGEADALAMAAAEHDKAADWGLESCLVEMTDGICPEGKQTMLTFPEALSAFLQEHGYLKESR